MKYTDLKYDKIYEFFTQTKLSLSLLLEKIGAFEKNDFLDRVSKAAFFYLHKKIYKNKLDSMSF